MQAKLRWRPEEAGRAALSTYAARYGDLPVWGAMLASAAWDLGRNLYDNNLRYVIRQSPRP